MGRLSDLKNESLLEYGNSHFSALSSPILLSLLIAVLVSLGCERNVAPVSSVEIDLEPAIASSKISAQASQTAHIVVNVSAADMKRVAWNWDYEDACQSGCDPTTVSTPSVIELDIPKGSQRLIQILLVNQSADSGAMEFIYGDSVKDLASDIEDVTISATNVSTGTGAEMDVVGRYRSPTGVYPSGPMIMAYKPPNRPPMEIMKEEIFSGWFSAFVMDGVKFSYILPATGELLFGQPVDINETFFADSSLTLTVTSPDMYIDDDQDGIYDGSIDRFEASMKAVYGFWTGAAIDPNSFVCRDNINKTYSSTYVDSGFATAMAWPESFTFSASANSCTAIDPLVSSSQMILSAEAFAHGPYEPSFQGPFMKFTGANNHLDLLHHSYDTTYQQLHLAWKYLPGVANDSVDGVDILVASNVGDIRTGGPGSPTCDELISNYGFSVIQRVPAPAETTQLSIAPTELANMSLVACPYKGLRYARSLIEAHCLDCTNGGVSGASKVLIDGAVNSLATEIAFSRPSVATYVDSTGKIVEAAAEIPRFDYDPIDMTPRGLLIEEERTNLLSYSEDFAAWDGTGGAAVTVDSATAPTGIQVADVLTDNDTLLSPRYVHQSATINMTGTYTASLFIEKLITGPNMAIGLQFDGGTTEYLVVSPVNGGFAKTAGITTAAVESYGQWFRITASASPGTTPASILMTIYPAFNSTPSSTLPDPATTGSLAVFGAQIEFGSFATSYIPTVTASVTRAADNLNLYLPNLPEFNYSSGTFVVDASHFSDSTHLGYVIHAVNTGATEHLGIKRASGKPTFYSYAGATSLNHVDPTIWGARLLESFAFAYEANNFQMARNGTVLSDPTLANVPLLETLYIGSSGNNMNVLNGHISFLEYANWRLPDTDISLATSP